MTKLVAMRGIADCGVACLAMLAAVDYETALEAISLTSRRPARKGLYLSQLQRAALHLGLHTTKRRKGYRRPTARGILSVESPLFRHFLFLEQPWLIDPDGGEVWRSDEWLLAHPEFTAQTLLSP